MLYAMKVDIGFGTGLVFAIVVLIYIGLDIIVKARSFGFWKGDTQKKREETQEEAWKKTDNVHGSLASMSTNFSELSDAIDAMNEAQQKFVHMIDASNAAMDNFRKWMEKKQTEEDLNIQTIAKNVVEMQHLFGLMNDTVGNKVNLIANTVSNIDGIVGNKIFERQQEKSFVQITETIVGVKELLSLHRRPETGSPHHLCECTMKINKTGKSPMMLVKEDIFSLRELIKNVQEPLLANSEQIVVLLGKLSTDILDLHRDFLRSMGVKRGKDEPK